MKNYVVGFAFWKGQVLLIEKRRPAWQAGMLNCIGGKIEPGETPMAAMHRECMEETGLELPWVRRALMTGDFNEHEKDIYLHIFYAESPEILHYQQKTDETLCVINSIDIFTGSGLKFIENLFYLIPFGFDKHIDFMRLRLKSGGFKYPMTLGPPKSKIG